MSYTHATPARLAQGPDGLHTATGGGRDLRNLDVLRAVAVASVVCHHVLQSQRLIPYGMGFGGFGVGLFFVHTALVLMWSLERRPDAVDFYVRRIARIYPLAVAAVVLAVVLHAPVAPYGAQGPFFSYVAPTTKQFLEHVLLVQNFFSGNFLVYTMWSLPLEVQMYALLPVAFFLLRREMKLWPLLAVWAAVAGFALLRWGPGDVNLGVSAPYFLSGLIAYVGFSRRRPVWDGWVFVVFLAVIVAVGGRLESWQLCWLPCLVLGLMLPSFRQLRENGFTRACWQVARYSYGIYLVHPFAIALAFHVCRGWPMAAQVAVLLASLVGGSVAAFHLIEAPGMRLGARVAEQLAARRRRPVLA